MRSPIAPFAVVTLVPVLLLGLGGTLGSGWLWAALFYLTIFTFAADSITPTPITSADQNANFQAADALSIVLALAHFALLLLAIRTISGASSASGGERLLAFFAFGLFFGQVSNSNAHELIHRPGKALHWLGAWVFISLLFGHHTSAHRLVHHRFVATNSDPNSAPKGMTIYRFLPRAWIGSFRNGWRAEVAMGNRVFPYAIYVVGGVAMLALAGLIGGAAGVLAYLALAIYASTQILMSDYVQHYGLRRAIGPDGKPETMGAHHSWDAPHRFSGVLMLNAPRHSDHHNHPARPYPALELPANTPILPFSLPVMGLIAWSPHLWRGLMHPRLAELGAKQGKDRQ